MFDRIKVPARCFLVVGLLVSSGAQAFVLSVFDKDSVRAADQRHVGGGFIVGGLVSMFLFPPATPFAFGIGAVLDGHTLDTQRATLNPRAHLATLVDAGVYSATEANQIDADLVSIDVNREQKLAQLGCAIGHPDCGTDAETFRNTFGLSALTMQYLGSLRGVQN